MEEDTKQYIKEKIKKIFLKRKFFLWCGWVIFFVIAATLNGYINIANPTVHDVLVVAMLVLIVSVYVLFKK